jgi:uracil-DNA glycosylase family 4
MHQEKFFDWGEAIPYEHTGASNSGCKRCPLQKDCKSPKMEFQGKGEKKVLILFENPTSKEDKTNKPFSDVAADDLRYYLEDLDFDLGKDCWFGYAVSCHTSSKIADNHIGYCQDHLYGQINRFSPKVIIPMGNIAIKALLKFRVGGRLSGIEYKQYIGHSIPDQEWEININPNYSLEDIYASEDYHGNYDKVTVMRFKQHIKKAFNVAAGAFYKHNYEKDIVIYFDKKEIIALLEKVLSEWTLLIHDYETTGLKPYAEGHKIYTVGISDGNLGHAFPYLHNSPRFRTLWKKIQDSPKIRKVAHNAKFENIWSTIRADCKPQNFHWCTMIAEHILKNKSVVGAKFLFYVYLGVMNMDNEVDRYLKPSEADIKKYGGNAINTIHKIWEKNPRAVLQYQGEDALYTAKLYELQVARFKRRTGMKKAFEYYHDGILALGDVQMDGIHFDVDKCGKNLDFMNSKIDNLWKRTLMLPEANGWEKNLTGKAFQSHLYDTLKYEVPTIEGEYKPGNRPESKEALEKIGTDFTNKVIMLRQQTKIKTTIEGYLRECDDGIIRPSYGGHNVDTFRTSSNSPNIQNPFKRNKFAKKMLREMIIPSPGRQLVGKDYKAIEVSIAGCIFPDDAWLRYCVDPSTDMHRDCAAEILQMQIEEYILLTVAKIIRQWIKNTWVFPNIYGSGAKNMAQNIWKALMEIPEAKEILLSKFGNFQRFNAWIKEYYDYYWEEKYPDYKRQRDKAHERYERVGYIDSPVGYRYYGPMSYNDFCNYPVQGSAAAIKVWTIKEANRELKQNKMDSCIIYEIHDEIGGDVVPDERKEYDEILEKVGTKDVREYWDWIITPLVLETEESDIDGNWSEMEEKE